MLHSLYLKTVRDRWLSASVGVASLFLVAWMGLWAYAGMGDEALKFIATMPPAYKSLTGTTADAGVAGLMLGQMFNFLGPFVIAGIGISMGAGAIAGEESRRTMSVLSSVPRSRSGLLASKGLAIATIVTLSSAVASLSYLLGVAIVGEDIRSLDLVAGTAHLTAVALFYATVAFAIGAATGLKGLASGVATGYLVLSFLAVGFLPLFSGWESVAKFFPWYVLNGSQPLVDGIVWAQIAILLSLTAVLAFGAWWGINRRDLREGESRAPVVIRLKSNPRFAVISARLSGAGSARSIVAKTLSDVRAVTIIAGGGLFLLLVVMGPMFTAMADSLGNIVDAMPQALLAMVGFADYSSPTGWYHGEALSVTAPVAISVVTIAAGMALAREEANRTIAILLSAPISRYAVAWRKAAVLALLATLMGVVVFGGIAVGNLIAGLGMDYSHIATAGLLSIGLGCVLGAVAFLAGALSGKTSIAMGSATGVAILGWGINSFVAVNPDLEGYARLSPFYYYANNFPLENGLIWWHLVVLIGAAAVLVSGGVWGYARRDLRG